MPDNDFRGNAWRVTPSAYLERRPAIYGTSAPTSRYLEMEDGCRLAIDIYLPTAGETGVRRWPTIVMCTPYYRRFKVAPDVPRPLLADPRARFCDMFVPRGYALIVLDVRGTGASFGTRDSFRSPRERDDYREVVEWIVAQPWSDGAVGATGVSYLAAASDFLASTGHPAVKAIAPICGVWDTSANLYYPGGVHLNQLTNSYDALMIALDHDRREILRDEFPHMWHPDLDGPQPVDDDTDGSACAEAIRQHAGNFRMRDFITEFKFRDDALSYNPDVTSASFSPYNYATGVRPEVAVYSIGGWFDGHYADGAIVRFLTLAHRNRYLLLGPWDHGARANGSPWRDAVEPTFPILAEILRFFDEHLAGLDTGLQNEAPVHYFVSRAEAWRAAESWPLVPNAYRLSLGAQNALVAEAEGIGADAYRVDFARGTGYHTRYERMSGKDCPDLYDDWQGRDEAMLSYTSEVLADDLELAGHPILSLWLSCSEPDASIFAYLSEVEADGSVRYVTEGLLRALSRAEVECPSNYRTTWPYHSFTRKDAIAMPADAPQLLHFALLANGWRFAAGSRIRLSIAGADADHCAQVPHGRPPELNVHWGGEVASYITLPATAMARYAIVAGSDVARSTAAQR